MHVDLIFGGKVSDGFFDGFGDQMSQLGIERLAKHSMGDDAKPLEKGGGSQGLGAVDDLSGDYDISRPDLFPQAPDGRECHNHLTSDLLQRRNIGLGGNLRRVELMRQTMSSEECNHRPTGKFEDRDGRRGRTPWRIDVETLDRFDPFEFVQSRASNNAFWVDENGEERRKKGQPPCGGTEIPHWMSLTNKGCVSRHEDEW